jgi:hypothetical protein
VRGWDAEIANHNWKVYREGDPEIDRVRESEDNTAMRRDMMEFAGLRGLEALHFSCKYVQSVLAGRFTAAKLIFFYDKCRGTWQRRQTHLRKSN